MIALSGTLEGLLELRYLPRKIGMSDRGRYNLRAAVATYSAWLAKTQPGRPAAEVSRT